MRRRVKKKKTIKQRKEIETKGKGKHGWTGRNATKNNNIKINVKKTENS